MTTGIPPISLKLQKGSIIAVKQATKQRTKIQVQQILGMTIRKTYMGIMF